MKGCEGKTKDTELQQQLIKLAKVIHELNQRNSPVGGVESEQVEECVSGRGRDIERWYERM